MSFRDEIAKLKRRRSSFMVFSEENNPGVLWEGGDDKLCGRQFDARGPIPIEGVVQTFGTLNRAVTNIDLSFEAPTISPTLIDEGNYWRQLASPPSHKLLYRWLRFMVRVLDDNGWVYDQTVGKGQITDPQFLAGKKVQLTCGLTPGDWLGSTIPRRQFHAKDFPRATPEVIGMAVPFVYGVLSNKTSVSTVPTSSTEPQVLWADDFETDAELVPDYVLTEPLYTIKLDEVGINGSRGVHNPYDGAVVQIGKSVGAQLDEGAIQFATRVTAAHSIGATRVLADIYTDDYLGFRVALRPDGCVELQNTYGTMMAESAPLADPWNRFHKYEVRFQLTTYTWPTGLGAVSGASNSDGAVSVYVDGLPVIQEIDMDGVGGLHYENVHATTESAGFTTGHGQWGGAIYFTVCDGLDDIEIRNRFLPVSGDPTETPTGSAPAPCKPTDDSEPSPDAGPSGAIKALLVDSGLTNILGSVAGKVTMKSETGVPGGPYGHSLGLSGPEMGGVGSPDLAPAIRAFGVLPGTVPTGITMSQQFGGSIPSTRNNSWSAMVTAIHGGVESDPSPLGNTLMDFAGGWQSVRVNWTAAAGGADGGYNVYLTNNPYGVTTKMSTLFASWQMASDYVKVRHVASGVTSTDFTNLSDPDYTWQKTYLYTVTAILPGALETAASHYTLAVSQPYRRPLHLRWYAYTGAIGYRIRRAPWVNNTTEPVWDTFMETTRTGETGPHVDGEGKTWYEFFDSLGGTGVPGEEFHGPVYALAGHTLKKVNEVYVLKPDQHRIDANEADPDHKDSNANVAVHMLQVEGTDYQSVVKEINGNRYHCLVFQKAQMSDTCEQYEVSANVEGAETNGDSTGTLITDAFDMTYHMLLNWVFNSYRSSTGPHAPAGGRWFTDVPYSPGLVNKTSFDQAKAIANALVNGGYVGAGILSTAQPVVQFLQDLMITFGLDLFFDNNANNGAWSIALFAPETLSTFMMPRYTPEDSIFKDTFECHFDLTNFANVIPYFAGPMTGRTAIFSSSGTASESKDAGYYISGEVRDSVSIDKYGELLATPINLVWTRDAATAGHVVQDRLRMVRFPPVVASCTVPIGKMVDSLASCIRVTHPDGLADGNSGWVDRVCRIVRSDIDLDKLTVKMLVRDVHALVD